MKLLSLAKPRSTSTGNLVSTKPTRYSHDLNQTKCHNLTPAFYGSEGPFSTYQWPPTDPNSPTLCDNWQVWDLHDTDVLYSAKLLVLPVCICSSISVFFYNIYYITWFFSFLSIHIHIFVYLCVCFLLLFIYLLLLKLVWLFIYIYIINKLMCTHFICFNSIFGTSPPPPPPPPLGVWSPFTLQSN